MCTLIRVLSVIVLSVPMSACMGMLDGGGLNGGGDGDGDAECDYSSDCAWDEFCYDGDCEGVLGRRYDVTIISASVPSDGDYDSFGGAPDLTVVFGTSTNDACQTTTVDDVFSATWNQACDFVLEDGGYFEIDLIDIDTAEHDLIAGWYWDGSDDIISLVRGYGQSLTVNSGSEQVKFRIEPDF
jgi:hypothetical protein